MSRQARSPAATVGLQQQLALSRLCHTWLLRKPLHVYPNYSHASSLTCTPTHGPTQSHTFSLVYIIVICLLIHLRSHFDVWLLSQARSMQKNKVAMLCSGLQRILLLLSVRHLSCVCCALPFAKQDVHSKSGLVRLYYSQRIFMGFCCICCEVEYLALYLLSTPRYQKAYLIPLQLPKAVLQLAAGTGFQSAVVGWQGLPFVGLIALLALPGVAVKQLCNWVQLRAAMESLVAYDGKKMS